MTPPSSPALSPSALSPPPAAPTVLIQARTASAGVRAELAELWRYKHLVRTLVERDLRVRYKNSVLGIAWTMVSPLIQVFVLTIAIGYILGSGPKNLSAYIFCATVPWTFFQTAILDSSTSVLGKLGLLKKVYFPREIPLIATVCQNFFQFLVSLGIFMVYRWALTPLLFGWPGLPPLVILWLPLLIADLFLLTLGTAFFVAAANVFYEDVKFILSLTIGFLFYLMPIIYFAENVFYSPRIPHRFQWWAYHLYLANPLAWLITAFKQVFFGKAVISNVNAPIVYSAPFDWRYLALATASSVLICLWGYSFFNRHKWKFTERP